MKKNLRIEAEKLANRPYQFIVQEDETTDGQKRYAAISVELDGCVGQGTTELLALEDARMASIDYIESLLEDGLDVPFPLKLLPVSFSTGYPVKLTTEHQESDKQLSIRETRKPDYITVPAYVH